MVANKKTYEELRLQRIEENRKRMEDLNLNILALSLKASSSKPSPAAKQAKPRLIQKKLKILAVRKSSRNIDKPAPVYREMADVAFERSRRSSSYKRRDSSFPVASQKARDNARDEAELLESTLGNKYPTFVKPMLHSHVNKGFWLGLPVDFCNEYLPKNDAQITLVDGNGDTRRTKYLAYKKGLSAGWRGFSLEHNLVDGDALVFQLITPTTFKVYIIKANELD